MDRQGSGTETEGREQNRERANYWTSWAGLGLLAAAVVLPFGWILPIARLARARVLSRRDSSV